MVPGAGAPGQDPPHCLPQVLLSSLPVSTMKTRLLHFLKSALVGKSDGEDALASHLAGAKLRNMQGWRSSLPEVLVGPMLEEIKVPPKTPANWSEHMESDTAQSSLILLEWAQHHLQGPVKGPDHAGGRQGQPALLG